MKPCAECGKVFEPGKSKKKPIYCSPQCRGIVSNRNRRIREGQKLTDNCDVCGEVFDVNVHNKKYCSVECRLYSSRRWYKHDIPQQPPRKCEKCGKTHTSGNRWYCPVCHGLISEAFSTDAEGVDGFTCGE